MTAPVSRQRPFGIVGLALAAALAACAHGSGTRTLRDQECMARVMYFESNRSSDDGMLAVGTVVMNRLNSGRYANTVCGVVGQPGQYAPGALSRPKTDRGRERAERMAAAVLSGKRSRSVGKAMFFHTAGYNFPYRNMDYKVIAGGNAFYDKHNPRPGERNTTQWEVAARQGLVAPTPEVQVASLVPRTRPRLMPAAPPPMVLTPRAAPRIIEPEPPLLAVAPVEEQPASIEALILASGA
jgi:spore germination cell wall hydrolase CwlJ-like protein